MTQKKTPKKKTAKKTARPKPKPADVAHIAEELRPLAVPIDAVARDPRNAMHHGDQNVDAIAASLARFGQRQPLVVNRATGTIEAGNGRHQAAESLGWGWVAVLYVDDDPQAATGYAIADNRTAELAEWDDAVLVELLGELTDAGETDLLDALLLADLVEAVDETEAPEPQPERAAELQKEWKTKPGQLWTVGRHRILCGDATDPDAIAHLFGDASAEIVLTDPPYCSGGFQEAGRVAGSIGSKRGKVAGSGGKQPTIARDNLTTAGLFSLVEKAIGRAPASGCCYVFADWRQIGEIRKAIEPLGFQFRAMLIWDKESPGMGGPWRHQYETVWFGSRRKEPPHGQAGDVLRCKRSGNQHHPTEKPVDLLVQILENTEGQTVYDPFAGSGSTLLAAEQAGRDFFGCEVDPKHCAVLLERAKAAGLAVAKS